MRVLEVVFGGAKRGYLDPRPLRLSAIELNGLKWSNILPVFQATSDKGGEELSSNVSPRNMANHSPPLPSKFPR